MIIFIAGEFIEKVRELIGSGRKLIWKSGWGPLGGSCVLRILVSVSVFEEVRLDMTRVK